MIYPEMPKSKFRPTYIAGGIFAFLFGIIVLGLYIPNLCSDALHLSFKPWDWNSIGVNGEMLESFAWNFINPLLPVVLIIVTVGSFLIGRAKSSTFAKLSILSFLIALLLKYLPIRGNSPTKTTLEFVFQYAEIAFCAAGLVLLIMALVFLFKNDGRYVAYHANSFHIFAATFLFVFCVCDILFGFLDLPVYFTSSVPRFVTPCFYGLFALVGGVWLLFLMKRDPLEFGMDPKKFQQEKEAKEQGKNQSAEKEPEKEPQKAAEKEPEKAAEKEPEKQPQKQPQKVATPKPEDFKVGPDGVKYRLVTQKLPNGTIVSLRVDERGKPLPPLQQKKK